MAQAKKAALPHRRLICRLDAALQLVLVVLMLSCSSVWRNFAIACMQFSLLDLGCNIGAASFDATTVGACCATVSHSFDGGNAFVSKTIAMLIVCRWSARLLTGLGASGVMCKCHPDIACTLVQQAL